METKPTVNFKVIIDFSSKKGCWPGQIRTQPVKVQWDTRKFEV